MPEAPGLRVAKSRESVGCSTVTSAFPGPGTKFGLPIIPPASLTSEGGRIQDFKPPGSRFPSQNRHKCHSPPLPTLSSALFSALGEVLKLLEQGFIHEVGVGVSSQQKCFSSHPWDIGTGLPHLPEHPLNSEGRKTGRKKPETEVNSTEGVFC